MNKIILTSIFSLIFLSSLHAAEQEMSQELVFTDAIALAKEAITKALKKNQGMLMTIAKNPVLKDGLAKIEGIVNKIVESEAFKSTIEKIISQQIADITQGKSFADVDYDHQVSKAFKNMININPFLAKIYNIKASIAHYTLLLERLNTTDIASLQSEQSHSVENTTIEETI